MTTQSAPFGRWLPRFLACLLLFLAAASQVEAGTYCAIAVSPSTHRYGHSRNHNSRAEAEAAALSYCNAWDARIATWGYNGYLALALGSGTSWGGAYASTESLARAKALANCPGRSKRVVLVVYSLAR